MAIMRNGASGRSRNLETVLKNYLVLGAAMTAITSGLACGPLGGGMPPAPPSPPGDESSLSCVEILSSGSFGCTDAGNYPGTCATAKCPGGYTLTGGGGACAAGDRRIKSLFPRLSSGELTIMCEEQGVPPQAVAICCQP